MKKIIAVILISIGFGMSSNAQDAQFSQYYSSPLYLNPGFAGTGQAQRIMINSRIQWASLPSSFTTNAVAWDMNVPGINSGIGVMAMVDKAGSVNLTTANIGVLYASKIQFSKNWIFSPGLQFAYGSRMIDTNKLLLGDQIEWNGPTSDDIVNKLTNKSFFDFSAGGVIYNRNFWFGVSAHHLNQPNYSILGEDSKVPVKYSVHSGYRFPLDFGPLSANKISGMTTSFVYKQQGQFKMLDIGANAMYDPIMFGLWYRGIPLTKSMDNAIRRDALVLMLGMNLGQLELGYSYDITVSALGPKTGGSHEFSLKFEFSSFNPNKVKRKDKFLPCPNFTGFGNQF